MQGVEGNRHLDGGTIGVGDDLILRGQDIGIDLRNHQGVGRGPYARRWNCRSR